MLSYPELWFTVKTWTVFVNNCYLFIFGLRYTYFCIGGLPKLTVRHRRYVLRMCYTTPHGLLKKRKNN